MHGHKSINANSFKAYNQHSFCINVIAQLIESPFFENLANPSKLQILESYKEMLVSKAYIDHYVFKRKSKLVQNYRLLKQLSKHYQALNDPTYVDELAPFIAELTPNYFSNSSNYEFTNQLKAQINGVNAHRLDGVWSRGFTKSLLDFKSISWPKLMELDTQVEMINGISSYGLYFLRGGLDFCKIIKHSFDNNPFYDQQKISFYDKFSVQWELRYSQIINDICLWGPVNAKTYLDWRDARGELLTAFLLIADLIHSIWIYFKTTAYFDETLKIFTQQEVQDELKSLFAPTLQKQLCFMAYQTLLIISFSAVCGFFFFHLSSPELVPFNFYGSLVCFIIQILVNLIDLAFEVKNAKNSIDTKIACFKIMTRVMVQLLIPSMFIAAAYLLPVLEIQLPSLLVVSLLMVFSSLVVKLANDINHIFEVYMNPALLDPSKQDKALQAILTRKDESEINQLIDEWVEIYEASYQNNNAHNQLHKDLWLTASFIASSVALCMLVSRGLGVDIVLPVVFALFSLSMSMAQPTIKENPKAELSTKLGFAI